MQEKQLQLRELGFYTGVSHKIGEVHEGSAVMDWMEQEPGRGRNPPNLLSKAGLQTLWNWENSPKI